MTGMMPAEDTIAAVSTPMGTGGVSMIRISGGRSFAIASAIFRSRSRNRKKREEGFNAFLSHTVGYGIIVDNFSAPEEIIDEVLITKMKAPDTFTREDTVEISCHGGYAAVSRILDIVIRNGARAAAPGEFTRRAFLNGRIDLAQAEAVIDAINAGTGRSLKAAMNQLEGRLSREVRSMRGELLDIIAGNEAVFDYPEHDIEDITGKKTYEAVKAVAARLAKLLAGYDRGRILREGISAVIAGKPNVGKSTIMNEITGLYKSIVTDMPGTTRDIIEELINFHGIPVRIMDTAGIRGGTGDEAEKIGVDRARKAVEDADLIIVVLDASTGISAEDGELLELIEAIAARRQGGAQGAPGAQGAQGAKDAQCVQGAQGAPGIRPVFVINKSDLAVSPGNMVKIEKELSRRVQGLGEEDIARISAVTGEGLEELEDKLKKRLLRDSAHFGEEAILTNSRHKAALEKALNSLEAAAGAYMDGVTPDCVEIDIREAAGSLGEITGETLEEDMLDRIFSSFCIGK
ncbi:MAG: tRNA uridine-5-carboxymethylaminomethyl(34) synthesis GTPase MnmE [Eubacteriales bacterium]|nr:tRNA uridine-5-carboxymethylaminomethyl(34) synthesis GTPase MnmE [Eubacteriales bacterium]